MLRGFRGFRVLRGFRDLGGLGFRGLAPLKRFFCCLSCCVDWNLGGPSTW